MMPPTSEKMDVFQYRPMSNLNNLISKFDWKLGHEALGLHILAQHGTTLNDMVLDSVINLDAHRMLYVVEF